MTSKALTVVYKSKLKKQELITWHTLAKKTLKQLEKSLRPFPELKFGVKKMHGGSNGVDVTIKSGKVDFTDCFTHGDGYAQINLTSHICMVTSNV